MVIGQPWGVATQEFRISFPFVQISICLSSFSHTSANTGPYILFLYLQTYVSVLLIWLVFKESNESCSFELVSMIWSIHIDRCFVWDRFWCGFLLHHLQYNYSYCKEIVWIDLKFQSSYRYSNNTIQLYVIFCNIDLTYRNVLVTINISLKPS